MKRTVKLSLIGALVAIWVTVFSACDFLGGETASVETPKKGGIALVYAPVSVSDPLFNLPALEGVKEYADGTDRSYKTYMPDDSSSAKRTAALEAALAGGADTVVCYGPAFRDVIDAVASTKPGVKFIVLDEYAAPKVMNVAAVPFRTEQAGYAAGYAAVKEGYRNLGFMGSDSGASVALYGWGFIQGANAAAAALGLTRSGAGAVSIKFLYFGSGVSAASVRETAVGWFTETTAPAELIFAAGGSIYESVAAAASDVNALNAGAAKKTVIASDTDRSGASDAILTSAVKGVKRATAYMLKVRYESEFPGGKLVPALGAVIDGTIGLSQSKWSFKNFTAAEYDGIIRDMKSNNINVRSDWQTFKPAQLSTLDSPNVTVIYRV
ncbi:MAG: BMP family ABC transporter substrate-binding protein [Clostridiales bacterium]|nr:BMP family ABC transporter substrate-binding protein [Clostridiales bacterium]